MKTLKLKLSIAAGIVCLAFATSAMAQTHAPILIVGDAQFTAANGVINPGAAGTAADPYIIPNWTINGGSNVCVRIESTTRFFEVRNINCSNAAIGVLFLALNNGKLLNSTITQIRGNTAAVGFNAGIGVFLAGTNQMTLANNTISNVTGQLATAPGDAGGSAFGMLVGAGNNFLIDNNSISQLFATGGASGNSTTPFGGPGGSAIGIFSPFGMILPFSNATVTRNRIERLNAGIGGLGGSGTFAMPGGQGGSGGDAFAMRFEDTQMINVSNNTASNLFAGMAGLGGSGGFSGGGMPGGAGGNGGAGGSAFGYWFQGSNITNRSNTLLNAYAGSGAPGGFGGFGSGSAGGRGGDGGAGGEAAGAFFNFSTAVLSQTNIFNTMVGGNGGNGGRGGFGSGGTAMGGKGGNGGNGVGLHYRQSTAFTNIGNTILNQRGGRGGIGGFPGGANGTPGSSLPILID